MRLHWKLTRFNSPKDIRSTRWTFHRVLLFLPTVAVVIFTVLPLLFMITLAFTNYDRFHMPPGNLFTWVGLENFRAILGLSGNVLLGKTFRSSLGWTLT